MGCYKKTVTPTDMYKRGVMPDLVGRGVEHVRFVTQAVELHVLAGEAHPDKAFVDFPGCIGRKNDFGSIGKFNDLIRYGNSTRIKQGEVITVRVPVSS